MVHYAEFQTAEEVRAHYKAVRARVNAWQPASSAASIELQNNSVESTAHQECAREIEVLRARIATLEVQFAKLVHSTPAGIDGVVAPEPILKRPRIHDIKLAVVSHYGYSINLIDGFSRTADVVQVRHIAQHLARKLTLRSLPEIGQHFGGRDHTSVLHADRMISRRRAQDLQFNEELLQLEGKILSPLA